MTSHRCSVCGALLTQDEYEEFEDECFDCVFEETSGIIEDSPYRELDSDE
jgi:hypothetical protein